MVLATERPARTPATQRKRPLSDVPVGHEVNVPRMEDNGTRFWTWCKVVSHVPCSYGDSIVVDIPKQTNQPKEVDQQISLAKLEQERESPDVDWVRPPRVPVVKSIAASSSSNARMPKTAAAMAPEAAPRAVKEAKPKPAHRQAAAERVAPRASEENSVHCCDVKLPLPQSLSASACKLALGKPLPVYWKSTDSGTTLYVLPPGHESETYQIGWAKQHQAPLLEVPASSPELEELMKNLWLASKELSDAPTFSKGNQHETVPLIRDKLRALGFLRSQGSVDNPRRFDEAMDRGVASLQRFHQIAVTRRVRHTELTILGVQTNEMLEKTRLASLTAMLQFKNGRGGELQMVVSLHLHSLAFDFDQQVTNGSWSHGDVEEARRGNLPPASYQYESRRALGRALRQLLRWPESTLGLGPASDLHTLNSFGGAPDSFGGAASSDGESASTETRVLRKLLRSIAVKDSSEQPSLADEQRAILCDKLRPGSELFPFQSRGVRWMLDKETDEEVGLSGRLHPAWIQLRSISGGLIFLHDWTGHLSRTFRAAPPRETCCGMLCDDTGLGKTLQVLSLIALRPAPIDWPCPELRPAVGNGETLQIKATLVVCPAILLNQWEEDLQSFFKDDELVYCVHGVDEAYHFRKLMEDEAQRRLIEGKDLRDTSVVPAVKYKNDGLFRGSYDKEVAPPIHDCDVVLCSYEALRDQESRGAGFGSLSNLAFWRVVLDESQQVGNDASKVAIACGAIRRANAWVTTATPFDDKLDALHGLLSFLGQEPFADDHAWRRLIADEYEQRSAIGIQRVRAILRSLMLRRLKQDDPSIEEQIQVPPMQFHRKLITLAAPEHMAYEVVATQMKKTRERLKKRGSCANANKRVAKASLTGDFTRLRQMPNNPYIIAHSQYPPRQGTMTAFLTTMSTHTTNGLLRQKLIMARTVTGAHAELEQAHVEHMRRRAVLLAAYEELQGSVPLEVSQLHGNQALQNELHHLATLALLRIPNNERQTVLETELVKSLKVANEVTKLDECDEAVTALRAMTGLTVDGEELKRLPHKRFTVGQLVANVLTVLNRAVQEVDVLHREGAQAIKEMQLQGILDDACLEKLRQGPPRWHKLSQTLEELWSRKRGRDAHRSGADGALGQLHKLLHPQEHGTRAAASTADSGEGTDDDEAQGGDPIARGQTAVNAATRKLSRKKGFLVYCSNKVIDHYRSTLGSSPEAEGSSAAAHEPRSSEECVVCLEPNDGTRPWGMTSTCMHVGHHECLAGCVASNGSCPVCRATLTVSQVNVWEPRVPEADASDEKEPSTQETLEGIRSEIREQYGSKVAELVLQVWESLANYGGKVVIFSSWNRLLDLAKCALESAVGHGLKVASMHGSRAETITASDRRRALQEFREPVETGGAHVLLLVLGTQDAGLNLNHARTVILMEPQLKSAAETQAAGRVTRIGQRHETSLIRLVVQHTVEPHIWHSARTSGLEERSAARDASLYSYIDEQTDELISLEEPASLTTTEDDDRMGHGSTAAVAAIGNVRPRTEGGSAGSSQGTHGSKRKPSTAVAPRPKRQVRGKGPAR